MTYPYRHPRHYAGPLRGALLDWAGTTVDHGCFAPVAVFVEVFAIRGVAVTDAEARGPMGLYKRDHIAAVAALPTVANRWMAVHGRLPDDADIDAMFADAGPRQIAIIPQHAGLIAGAKETIAAMRARGLKIGTCTGYTRAMMETLAPLAAAQGYTPDALVTPDDVPAGRPAPWMAFANAMKLNVYPMNAWVKIGDTVVDVLEGLNAGMWTIAVARTGSELGLTAEAAAALPPAELERRLEAIRAKLYAAGAHYVIDSIADVLPVLDEIEAHLQAI